MVESTRKLTWIYHNFPDEFLQASARLSYPTTRRSHQIIMIASFLTSLSWHRSCPVMATTDGCCISRMVQPWVSLPSCIILPPLRCGYYYLLHPLWKTTWTNAPAPPHSGMTRVILFFASTITSSESTAGSSKHIRLYSRMCSKCLSQMENLFWKDVRSCLWWATASWIGKTC